MARSARASNLETRASRFRLPVASKPIFARIAPGISLGYRRTATAGTWVVRVADGKGGAWTKRVGTADDLDDSNGKTVLTFWEAQEQAKAAARGQEESVHRPTPLTVERAAGSYLDGLEARSPRTAYDARLRLKRLFLPKFASTRIEELSRSQLEGWRNALVYKGDDAERRRQSQDTANRVLSIVKALLNHAVSDKANMITDDSAWRLVRPFQGVARARDVHFSVAEVRRLIEAVVEPTFRDLLIAGFLTGARYGELAACQVAHFDPTDETLWVPRGKTGPRTVILQPEAVTFFARVAADREREKPLLPRPDGGAWKASDQQRPMRRAVEAAKLDSRATFYALRHSYISRAVEAGMPLTVLAENCGTSVRMIETTYAKVLANKRRELIAGAAPRLFAT